MLSLFHKIKSIVGYSVATVVIVIALGISGVRFLLTTANLYHDEVEKLASKLLEQPVKIGSMDAKLSGLVPTIIFHKVQLLSPQNETPLFGLSRIDVGLSFESLVLNQEIIPQFITVRGANINITRTLDNEIKVEGLNFDNLSTSGETNNSKYINSIIEKWLLSRSEIAIEDSSISWRDEKNGKLKWDFDNVNFLLKNNDTHHQLSLYATLPDVLGDKVKLDVDIDGDIEQPNLWDAKLFLKSEKINLNPLQTYIDEKVIKINKGSSALTLWLDVEEGRVSHLSGDVTLDGFTYQYKTKSEAKINYVSAIFDAKQSKANVWNVSVDKFYYKNNERIWPESKFNFSFDSLQDAASVYVKADYLKLGVLSQIVNDHHFINDKIAKNLQSLNVDGKIRDFLVSWKDNKLNKVKAYFDRFSANAWKNFPAVKNISGHFLYEKDHGSISISSKASSLNFVNLFRDELKFNELTADIRFLNSNAGVLFEMDYLRAINDDASMESRASLWLPKNDASAYLDLSSHVLRGDVAKISNYLPVTIMSKPLVAWLDKGIASGKVNSSTIIFNGKLDDFPFKNNEGTFTADIDASDVVVDYQKYWPKIEEAKINAHFSGQGMKLHLHKAKVSNLEMTDSTAVISSFEKAKLEMKLAAKGTLSEAADFLVNSPIIPKAKEFVSSVKLSGKASSSIDISIPLGKKKKRSEKITYTGISDVQDGSLDMLENKIDIKKLNGRIYYNDKKIYSKKIQAELLQKKVEFKIATVGKDNKIQISAKGKIAPDILLSRFDIPGADKLSGEAKYSGDITFPNNISKIQHPVLTMQSDLRGVESELPEFLQKNKKEKHPVVFKTRFKNKKITQFELYFKEGSSIFEIGESRAGKSILKKGAVSFSSNKAKLPKRNVLYVDGGIKQLTPSRWYSALGLNKKSKAQTFFINPIVVNLSELALFTEDKKNNKNNIPVNPQTLPKFEGIIKKLSLNKDFLGRLDFKASKRNYGLYLDEFILSAKNMKLVGHGEWKHNKGNPRTNLDLTLSSNDFGSMLTELGFSAIIEHGTAQAVSKLHWYGTPAEFKLSALNGTIQLKLENGSIVDIDPSAGRLLGFFSLAALPRKLFGDFKSSVAEGFSFDKANGQIIIQDGDAYTDDFEITSPIADIKVSGRTGLADRDYENTVEVVPAVGDGVTGVVALLVNLPTAIGLWLIDKVTGEQLNEASTRLYEVKGSWSEPEIELIENF